MDGKTLRKIRFENDLTQKELADLLGTTQSYLSEMETGAKMISERTLFKVRKIFFNGNQKKTL